MSDKALKNAVARRDELAASINQAQQQIESWRRDLAKVDGFIAAWHEFAGIPASAEVPSSDDAGDGEQKPRLRIRPKPKHNSRKEDVAEAARQVISERGQPMSRSDLYAALIERGLTIEGTDPEMVLSTMLWRMQSRVVRLKSGGYWLPEVPYPEGGYEPPPQDSDSVFH